jgi:hypothetical protein
LGEKVQDGGVTHADDTPPADAPVAEPLELALPAFPTLRGQRWGDGETAALLLHEPGTDLDAWGALPALLALRLDAAVNALDLPGHGLSDDPWEPWRLPQLIAALTRQISPARPPAIVAAGETAGSALVQAADPPPAAIVALSPAGFDRAALATVRTPLVPKLLFAGALDGDMLTMARELANALGGWAVVSSLPTAERGTAMLAGRWGGNVAEHVAGFLREALVRRTP